MDGLTPPENRHTTISTLFVEAKCSILIIMSEEFYECFPKKHYHFTNYVNNLVISVSLRKFFYKLIGVKIMNVCMRITFKCTWDEMIARLAHNMSTNSTSHTSWAVAKENDHSLIFLANITDFAALNEPMMNEDQIAWDTANGCEYTAYKIEPMNA